MIGGTVALVVEVVLLPVKARTRLVESLAAALEQINEMERCIAAGIEQGVKIDIFAAANVVRFEDANGKANVRLLQPIIALFKQIGSTETMSRCSNAPPKRDETDLEKYNRPP